MATNAPPTRPPDTWAWAAVVVAVVDTIAVVASLVVALTNDLPLNIVETGSWLNLVAGTVFPLLAALMLRAGPESASRPPHQRRLAILFVGFGVLCAGTLVLHVYADHGLQVGAPLALPVAWVSSWLWIGVPCGILLILLWFPSGDVPGPRWRIVTAGLVVAYSRPVDRHRARTRHHDRLPGGAPESARLAVRGACHRGHRRPGLRRPGHDRRRDGCLGGVAVPLRGRGAPLAAALAGGHGAHQRRGDRDPRAGRVGRGLRGPERHRLLPAPGGTRSGPGSTRRPRAAPRSRLRRALGPPARRLPRSHRRRRGVVRSSCGPVGEPGRRRASSRLRRLRCAPGSSARSTAWCTATAETRTPR